MRVNLPPMRLAPAMLFATLALALLLLTMRWHIPMMLWDHFDLVPIYQAWMRGTLADSAFLHIHGGHMHTAAYAVLLLTTDGSAGHPWLDCFASWTLLLGYAAVIMRFARDSFAPASRSGLAFLLLIAFLALFPGHLANLQWGWQVAVFLCLVGAAVTIRCLTCATLTGWHIAAALAAAALAFFSFATAIALVPTAVILIVLRKDVPLAKRSAFAAPWLIAGLLIAFEHPAGTPGHVFDLLGYVLNFLGAGIARFATDLAPWLAAAALASAGWAIAHLRFRRDSLPWLGLLLFGSLAGVLIALGRAGPFGSEQAFVTRYVSFSSMFWLGWSGLMGCALATLQRVPATAKIGVSLVALFAAANALHMMKKASEVAVRTRAIAQTLRSTYPQVDRALLAEIYFDQPDIALERLTVLHELGFAPFDAPSPATPLNASPH